MEFKFVKKFLHKCCRLSWIYRTQNISLTHTCILWEFGPMRFHRGRSYPAWRNRRNQTSTKSRFIWLKRCDDLLLALLFPTHYYNLLSIRFSSSHRRQMFLEPTAIKSSCYLLTEGRTELRTSLSSTTGPIRRSDHHFHDMLWFISSLCVERLVFLLCCCLLEVCVPHN